MIDDSTPQRPLKIGLVSVSDRASSGIYPDEGVPELLAWLHSALEAPFLVEKRLIPDEQPIIESTLVELVDGLHCDLILTTGGTGPARRDVTPEATRNVGTRELPGFGEQMRRISLAFVPTAILSRQTAVVRDTGAHAALIVNLPGRPASIRQTLAGHAEMPGLFAAIPYCIELIGGPCVTTHADVCAAFRPSSAKK